MEDVKQVESTRARVEKTLRRFVRAEEVAAVLAGAEIVPTLTIDSMTMIHLISELEHEFSVRFDHRSMERSFTNLGTLLEFLESRRDR